MVLNLPLMSALTTPTYSNKRDKKKKRNEQKETPTSDRNPNKGNEQRKETKSANHQIKAQKTTKSSPCTHASSP
jgi:hypothetical protein